MGAAEAGGMQIGRVLREARARAGLDIRAVEERTKIRTKYLRALENEEWDVLPSPAYAKGFLRTYAGLLGLDGEVLVDEFRRQVEAERDEAAAYQLRDRLLEGRRRPPGRNGRGPALALGLAALAIVGVLLYLGLSGGDAGDDPVRARDAGAPAKRDRQPGEGKRDEEAGSSVVRLALSIGSPVEICLLDASKRELIDGQVVAAGTDEGPWESRRFELRFPTGYDRDEVRLELDGEAARLPRQKGPSAFVVDASREPRPTEARRAEECP